MAVTQMSVFTESKPGHLARITKMFEEGGVNVRGYAVSDTGEYGIARFIVSDPSVACRMLEAGGFAFTTSEVLCVRLKDEPGELARVMEILAECDMNISYSYSMISTYIVLSVKDIAHAESVLSAQPLELISQADIKRIAIDVTEEGRDA